MSTIRPSGGLFYHLRALRSRSRWRGFTANLERWLFAWRPPQGKLILVGPSGGYTLSTEWLRGFSEIVAYDIDPLAPFFFGLRHPKIKVKFLQQDVFWRADKLTTTTLEKIVRASPGATVLFCNVFGQLPLEKKLKDGDLDRFLVALRTTLTGAAWASYHDLYTAEPLATMNHEAVAHAFEEGHDVRSGVDSVSHLELIDHTMVGPWSEGLKRERLAWPLTAKSLHLIEATF